MILQTFEGEEIIYD
jgi:predicted nucleotide-binding protein